MITLYTFGPAFGLPDPSPFVMKAEVLLKMSGLPYRTDTGGFMKAPKGKLPYLNDDGTIVADSTFIRWHLEKRHGIDFDRGLSAEQKAIGWAFEKMLEDQVYWAAMDARWLHEGNFNKGPRHFFKRAPALIRPLIMAKVRRDVKRNLHGQGMGRHSPDEIAALGTRSIDSTATYLADKPYFFGHEPSGFDATLFAFTAGMLCPLFETPLRAAAERYENLRRYVGRMTARYYPERDEMAGCRAAA